MSVTVVAEIGQNHQGSVEAARDLCEMAATPRRHDMMGEERYSADAVKLCKRDLDHELTREAASEDYEGRQSFGPTYGEHRDALELSWPETRAVAEHAKGLGLDVGITLCAPTCVERLNFEPAFLKVASRDLTHGPLLKAMAATKLPLVLSTGMHGRPALADALGIVTRWHDDVTILHCVSAYPTPPDDVNLQTIAWLQDRYDYPIGFSDHTMGLTAAVMAVAYGAQMIEKHVTLWRGMRGSDHQPAMDSDGLWRLCRDVRIAERMVGEYGIFTEESTEKAREKLERSLCAARDLEDGTELDAEKVDLLSPGTGISWQEREKLLGRRLTEAVERHTQLSSTMVV